MRFSLPTFAIALAVPAGVLALNTSDATSRYTDASSMSRAEKVAVSVLTNEGVVSGNDDRTFNISRTLNRAEFTKIAMNLHDLTTLEEYPQTDGSCFPDVKAGMWFSIPVCRAKMMGFVKGNPDGTFAPDRPVNYAEALKILGEIFGVKSEAQPGEEWYMRYVRKAQTEKLLLPINLPYDHQLTRGQMARLGAAYFAHAEGQLEAYRAAELGKAASSSSVSSSKAKWATCPDGYEYQTHAEDGSVINYFADPCLTHQLSSSSVSSMSSSSSSRSSQAAALYPAVSHLLTAEAMSPVLIDGTFTSQDEDGELRFVTVTLRNEVKSLSGLTLVDGAGNEIGKLKLALEDQYDKIWKGEYASGGYMLRKGVPVTLGIKASLKKDGVTSAELFETEDLRIQLQGSSSNTAIYLAPTTYHYPNHQVALGRIQNVQNAGPATGSLQAGLRRQIAAFAFSGAVFSQGGNIRLEQLTFGLQSAGLALSNFKVGGTAEIQQADCGIDTSAPQMLSCSQIPEAVNTVNGTRMIYVFANVTVLSGSTLPNLQLSLPSPGSMNVSGSVRWTDGAGRFNWFEGSTPVAVGTKWAVTK